MPAGAVSAPAGAELTGAVAQLNALVFTGALVSARVLAFAATAPFLGGRAVPVPARLGLGLAMAAALVPGVLAGAPPSPPGPTLAALLVAKEALVGFALGFVASLLFLAAEAAGRLSDTVRGANLAEVLVPQLQARSSALGEIGFQLAVLAFLATGGHRLALLALGRSFEALPLVGWPTAGSVTGMAALTLRLTADVLLVALVWSAPVLAASVLADLALGLITRAAPALPAYYVGMPLKAALGLVMALLALGALHAEAVRGADGVIAALGRAVRLLGP